MQLQFESEEQAKEAAQAKIIEILSAKQNLNPDKFDEVHQSYKRTIDTLEAQIAFNIRSQIESITLTRSFLEECYRNVGKCEDQICKMNESYVRDQEFHQEMELFEKLCFYRKNIGILLDQLKYFFNVKTQIEKMETMFSQGESNYDGIHFKLMALTDIRDNVIETIKKDYRVYQWLFLLSRKPELISRDAGDRAGVLMPVRVREEVLLDDLQAPGEHTGTVDKEPFIPDFDPADLRGRRQNIGREEQRGQLQAESFDGNQRGHQPEIRCKAKGPKGSVDGA